MLSGLINRATSKTLWGLRKKEQCQIDIGQIEFSVLWNIGNIGDNDTSSGRPFHVLAAATLNVLMLIVDSLNGGMTSRSVLAEQKLATRLICQTD